MRDAELLNIFTRRSFMVAAGQMFIFAVLISRLWRLQISQGDKFARLSDRNSLRVRIIPPVRGKIFDRDNRVLANNRNVYDVMMIPEEITTRGQRVADVLTRLETIIDISEREKARIHNDIRRKRPFFPVVVRGSLSWEEMSRIHIESLSLPGVYLEERAIRNYPHKEAGAHVIGYVAAVEERDLRVDNDPLLNMPGFRIGRAGMERVKDRSMRGRFGEKVQLVNAFGRVVDEMPDRMRAPVPGNNLRLTIDSRLQNFATERMANERAATAVVMDIHTGDVLAMVSKPSFDPNLFLDEERTVAEFRELIRNPYRPFTNKSIEGLYAPGSTFKMITAMAALEQGVINPATRFNCTGSFQHGVQRWWCWRERGHGMVDLNNSISQSCNVFYYNIATEIHMDAIQDMAHRFGLGFASNIELPGERVGQVPSHRWKLNHRAERWFVGDTVNSSIGQGFVLANPMQLCVMTARLVNGGYAVEPRLVKGEHEARPSFAKMQVNDRHLALMRRGMYMAVNNARGTAFESRFLERGARMGGKTGTSQVGSILPGEREEGLIAQEEMPWHLRNHALFVGYAPENNPRYAVSVLVEHGKSGSQSAAPIARDLMRRAIQLEVS